MLRLHWWARRRPGAVVFALCLLGAVLAMPAAVLAAPGHDATPTPVASATPDPSRPLNPPCVQDPPGIVIGTATPTPQPLPTGTPGASPTPTPTQQLLPM